MKMASRKLQATLHVLAILYEIGHFKVPHIRLHIAGIIRAIHGI